MSKADPIQAVVDIGCSQIRVTIAQCEDGGEPEILGCAAVNTPSMKQGVITDIAAVSAALRFAADEAERQSGFEIRNVDASIGGAQVSGINSAAQSQIYGRRISSEDVNDLVLTARRRVSDERHRLLHALQQQFIIDEHTGINNPAGMQADLLESRLHVIRAQKNVAENLVQTIEAAGIGVNALVSSSLASLAAAATPEERELGVCVFDIGAGASNFMVWEQGQPLFTGGINFGGERISSQLAAEFATTRQYAEMLKCHQGAMQLPLMKAASVELPSTGHRASRHISSQEVVDAIVQSYIDIFSAFEHTAHSLGMKRMSKGGFVLTGGASQIPGLATYAQENFGAQVRTAKPPQIRGLPDHLQHDSGMMTTLGMLKLLYEPITDYIWAKPAKTSIISRFKQIFSQRTR